MRDQLNFENRNEFPAFLNECGLVGTGAEIGVLKGVFSEHILRTWKGSTLFSIDAWRNFNVDEYVDINNRSNDEQTLYYAKTTLRLRSFGDRSIVWRMTSEQATIIIPDNTLDFCYIDADHSYDGVKNDLDIWLPKIKLNGIICGHDYIEDGLHYDKNDGKLIGDFGVQKAVKEFAARDNWDVYVTESEDYPSWFAFKS